MWPFKKKYAYWDHNDPNYWHRLNPDYIRLADYNAEVHRGIEHTSEWKYKMTKLQETFDREMTSNNQPPPNPPIKPQPHLSQLTE